MPKCRHNWKQPFVAKRFYLCSKCNALKKFDYHTGMILYFAPIEGRGPRKTVRRRQMTLNEYMTRLSEDHKANKQLNQLYWVAGFGE